MAHFELSQVIKSEKELSANRIVEFVKQRLESPCKYQVLSETADALEIQGRVRERFFTPVCRFTARFTTETAGRRPRSSCPSTPGPT